MGRMLVTMLVFSIGALRLIAQTGPPVPTPDAQPPGNPFQLPDGPNGFDQDPIRPLQGWWFDAGAVSYQRGYLGQKDITLLARPSPIAFVTTTSTVQVPIVFKEGQGKGKGEIMNGFASATVTFTSPVFQESAALPPPGSPAFGNYNDVPFSMEWGPRVSLGARWDRFAYELNGSYIPGHTSHVTLVSPPVVNASDIVIQNVNLNLNPAATLISIGNIPQAVASSLPPAPVGQLNIPFINAPAGFQGNQGLWTQADRVEVRQKTDLGEAEGIFRFWPLRGNMFQFHTGVRYIDLVESLSLQTQDDIQTAIPFPSLEANYDVKAHNRIVAGQFGMEVEVPAFALFSFSGYFKGAWGANFLTYNTALTRTDGLIGFNETRSRVGFSHLYELGITGDARIAENIHLMAGYKVFWLLNVAEAVNQIDYNLANTTGRMDNRGGVFFQGLFFSLQCRF